MAEGFTSSYNPVTGERREHRFEYTPTPPPQPELVSPTQMSETYKYFLSKANNPKAAIEAANLVLDAAKQFQGKMLWRQAERENRLDEKTKAWLGREMFVNSARDEKYMAEAEKTRRPPTVPQITPYQRESLDLQRQRMERPPTMTPYQQESIRLREQGMQNRQPTLDPAARADQEIAKAAYKAAVEELETTPRKEPRRIPLIGAKVGGNLDEIAELEKKRDTARAKLQGGGTLSEQAASTATGPETIRLTKDGKKAIFDSQTRKFLRYAD